MRLLAYAPRTGGFTVPRGQWVDLVRGMRTPKKGTACIVQGQLLLRVPAGVERVRMKLERQYAGGRRDGTGDVSCYVGDLPDGVLQHTWNHGIDGGPFTMAVRLYVPAPEPADDTEPRAWLRYCYGKVFV